MAIVVSKVIPTSSWYSGSGLTSITLSGVTSLVINTKKSLQKIQIPKSTSSAESTSSDKGINYVRDTKRVEDNIKIRGWLSDTTDSSAWTKLWKLRSMSVVVGALQSLVIEDLTFGTGSQQAFLEEVNFIVYPNRTQGLAINQTSSASIGKARIEIDLNFYLGDQR